jgi:hypothetical protein
LVWFFIIFVMALAFAPLLHFAPSKRQRRVARMREQAAMAGLFVEYRDPPGGTERPWPLGINSASVIFYGKRLPAKRCGRIAGVGWRRDVQGWCAVGGYVPVPESFEDLPSDVLAASADDGSCGVFWTEAEEGVTIEQIRSSLERWSEALCQPPK